MISTEQCVQPHEWLGIVQREYLDEFVARGGSAVKFVSGTEAVLSAVTQSLCKEAAQRGQLAVKLDPSTLGSDGKKADLHRIDRFFFAVTRDVDWRDLAARQVKTYLARKGIRTDGHELDDFEGIARRNGREPMDLYNEYQRELATPFLTDHELALEFRAALTALQRALIAPMPGLPTIDDVVMSWLSGQTMPGASAVLKQIQIYDRITQRNARHMLVSFCRWLTTNETPGLLVILDLRPYQIKRLTRSAIDQMVREAIFQGKSTAELQAMLRELTDGEPRVFYSDSAYAQMLALLRHFIDDIDLLRGLLLVVLTDPSFYYGEKPQRNYNDYDALQTRIGLEVRDSRRANPAATLVHLSETQ